MSQVSKICTRTGQFELLVHLMWKVKKKKKKKKKRGMLKDKSDCSRELALNHQDCRD